MAESPEHIQKHIKLYLCVFAALAVLTVITVAISYVEFGKPWNMVVGMIIATIKASLVALFFMHLISERKLIYRVLIFTAIFVFGLFFLTWLHWWSDIPSRF